LDYFQKKKVKLDYILNLRACQFNKQLVNQFKRDNLIIIPLLITFKVQATPSILFINASFHSLTKSHCAPTSINYTSILSTTKKNSVSPSTNLFLAPLATEVTNIKSNIYIYIIFFSPINFFLFCFSTKLYLMSS
jgi:hypothetical protein